METAGIRSLLSFWRKELETAELRVGVAPNPFVFGVLLPALTLIQSSAGILPNLSGAGFFSSLINWR